MSTPEDGDPKSDGRTMMDGVWLEECYISEDDPEFKITAKYDVKGEASYPAHSKGSGLTYVNAQSHIKFATGYYDHWTLQWGADDTHPDQAQAVHSQIPSGAIPAASDPCQVANGNYERKIPAARIDIYIYITGTVTLSTNRGDVAINGKAWSEKDDDNDVPSLSGKVTAYAGDPPVIKVIPGTSNPDERSFG